MSKINNIYYENSDGEKINLLAPPYHIQTGEIFNYCWSYTTTEGKKGGVITSFVKEVQEKEILIGVMAGDKMTYEQALDHLCDVVDVDVMSKIPGKLYVGDYYLSCFFIQSVKTDWEFCCDELDNTITIMTPYPYWVKEKKYSFPIVDQSVVEESKIDDYNNTPIDSEKQPDYPYDYKFDYQNRYKPSVRHPMYDYSYDYIQRNNVRKIKNDGYSHSDFVMTVYGPCTNPVVYIAGHSYQVNVSLDDREYLTIDSRYMNRNKSIIKHYQYGETENCFQHRSLEESVFEPIPTGTLTVTWHGTFAFDLTLLQERSEPKWT